METQPKDEHRGDEETNKSEPASIAEDTQKESAPYGPNSPLPIQKKSKKKWVLFVLLLLVIAGLGVAAVVSYFVTQKTVTSEESVTKPTTQYNSSKDLITDATSTLKGVPLAITSTDSTGGLQADGYYVYSLPSYRASETTYFNMPTEGTGAGYAGNSVTAESNFKLLTTFFAKNNFSLLSSQDNTSAFISETENVTYAKYATYESSDMLCAISDVDATPTAIKNHIAYIACATKDNYKKAAATIEPFATAYTKSHKDADVASLTFGNPTIKETAGGYKTATLYQDEPSKTATDDSTKLFFQGTYYLAPSSSDWSFLAKSDRGATLACSAYSADTAKKAFAGTACIDDTTKKLSAVK